MARNKKSQRRTTTTTSIGISSALMLTLSASAEITDTSGPCCGLLYSPVQFADSVLNELFQEHADEPLDAQASWLQIQLKGANRDRLTAMQAGLNGIRVVDPDDPALATADSVVEQMLSDRGFKWVDHLSTILATAFGGLIVGVVNWAIAGFRKRARRNEAD